MPTTTIRPTSNAAAEEWNPGTSTNWSLAGDGSDGTNIWSVTQGDQDLYATGSLPGSATGVSQVDFYARAKCDLGLGGGARVVVRCYVGASWGLINSGAIDTDWGTFGTVDFPRPGGGAWQVADFPCQLMVIADTIVDPLFDSLYVADTWLDVTYTEAAGGKNGVKRSVIHRLGRTRGRDF